MVAPLRGHDHAADLLDLGVVWRAHAIHVPGNLRAEISNADELLEDVLGHDVGVACLADVVAVDVDVVDAEVEVGSADGADTPVRLGAKRRLLVGGRGGDDELIAVHVGGLGGDGCHLARLLRLLLDLGNLLALLRGRGDLCAKNDVADFALREGADVDVVLLGVVGQDEVLERNLNLDPLLVCEARPDMVLLGRHALVGLQKHACLVHVDVQGAEDQDEAAEGRVGADALEPVVVDVEENLRARNWCETRKGVRQTMAEAWQRHGCHLTQLHKGAHHLRLGGLKDEVAKLLDLEGGLEGQLELRAGDDNVGEVEEMDLQGVKHALAAHDDALGLLLHWETADQGRHLLGGLPLGQLPQALLPGPHARVDDLEEELPGARVEDEDRAVDWLRGQVALKGLVDRHAVHVCVVHEPDDLVAEELAVVLARQVGLRRLGRVQLQALADALAQHVHGRVGLHDLGHRLDDQRLHPREPVAKGAVEVVGQVDADHDAGRGRVNRHVVRRVVQELGADVALDVVGVVVSPPELDVDPVLVAGFLVKDVVLVCHEAGLADAPLVRSKQQDVGARRVHLVALAGMDGLLLDSLDLQGVELLVEHLAQVHDQALVHLLPQMGAEDLDERDLERRDLAVHEDSGEVQLHLEADVHVCAVDGRAPPESETAVGDLVQTAPLGVCELLVLHALLKAAGLLPEETLPSREVGPLEQRVLQDALHAPQGLDDVRAVVVEVPQLPVVALVRPPERVLAEDLVHLELGAHAPALVVRQGVPVLLEEGVDARDAAVPRVLEVLQGEAAVLGLRLLTLEGILSPDALRVDKLALPGLDVAVEVGDELVLLVAHAGAEVRDAEVGLLAVTQVGLRDQDVAHGKHTEAPDLLGGVEDHRGETGRHLQKETQGIWQTLSGDARKRACHLACCHGTANREQYDGITGIACTRGQRSMTSADLRVETDLDAGLDLVLTLDEEVKELLGVNSGLAEVGHQPNQGRVPFVHDLGEGRGAGGHQDLTDAVLKRLQGLVVHAQERLRRALLGGLVLEAPDAVLVGKAFGNHANLREDADLKAAHVEQQVGVVLGVHRHKRVVPLERRHRAREAVLHVPEDSAAEVDVMLHQPHARVARPALLVVVPDDVLVVGVRVLGQVALDEVPRLLCGEAEHHVDPAGGKSGGASRTLNQES